MAPIRARCPSGFTMIEVLLAIGIFAMVMIAIYAAWSSILRGTRLGMKAAAEVQRTRVAIRALEESLGSALLYSDNAAYYSFFAETSGQFASVSFVCRPPQSFPGSGLFTGQDLRRVSFEVDQEGTLVLSQSPVLQSMLPGDPPPYMIKLAPKVGVFAMEFFDQRLNEWVPEWIYTNQLPRLVRVAVGFGEKGGGREDVTMRTIPIASIAIARAGGIAGGQPGQVRGPVPGQPGPVLPGGGGNPNRQGRGGSPGGPNFPGQGPGTFTPDGPGDFARWEARPPSNYGQNRGNVSRNPLFPPQTGRPGR